MKSNIILFLMVFTINLFSQEYTGTKAFSKFWFGAYGGVNFNTIPTVGGSVQLEAKTNITSNIRLKLSLGYSSIFENKQYEVKTYSKGKIDGETIFSKYTYSVNKMEYAIIPLNIGLEYEFTGNNFSPFTMVEFGYNVNSVEEQVIKSINSGNFRSLNKVPDEYKSPRPKLNESSFIDFGIGAGIRQKLSESISLSLQYVFRYNNGIPNTNQLLIGFTF